MAFSPATACGNPSLPVAPRAPQRGSSARAQALLCAPSTSAFRGVLVRPPAAAAPAPRWRRAAASTGIVCGKVRARGLIARLLPPREWLWIRGGW